jgi:hypothetical protein
MNKKQIKCSNCGIIDDVSKNTGSCKCGAIFCKTCIKDLFFAQFNYELKKNYCFYRCSQCNTDEQSIIIIKKIRKLFKILTPDDKKIVAKIFSNII